ncbi:MAG: hypothetical protein WCD42_02495 [Rhizomicrobium sp.]
MVTNSFDISNFLAGCLVLLSFLQLYQNRLPPIINIFAGQSFVLAVFVAWQAHVQDAPHLLITAFIALGFKAVIIPVALHWLIRHLGIHRSVETVVGTGLSMMAGMLLVGLAVALMMRTAVSADLIVREDMAFALSVVLLGLLMMVTRRNAVSQVIGFMSIENGLVLAGTGANGMPFVVEISVAFSVLVAFIIFGIFLFRIRERFDTVDSAVIDRFRGDRR